MQYFLRYCSGQLKIEVVENTGQKTISKILTVYFLNSSLDHLKFKALLTFTRDFDGYNYTSKKLKNISNESYFFLKLQGKVHRSTTN